MATCRKRSECCLTCEHWAPFPVGDRETFYDDGWYVSCNCEKVSCFFGANAGISLPQSYDDLCRFYSRDTSL